jgi:hypothetical protein
MARRDRRSEDWHPFYHPLTLHGLGIGVIVGAGLAMGRPAYAAGVVMFVGLCIMVVAFLVGRQWSKAQAKAAEQEPQGQGDKTGGPPDDADAS